MLKEANIFSVQRVPSVSTVIAALLMCQCHGYRFDITTGAVINDPAARPLNVYDVQEVGRAVRVHS
jgi:nitrite reductase/ring-hydroxylating ferredoxin subunit